MMIRESILQKLVRCLESDNMVQNSYDGKATLYLVPTPIGNLEDVTYRSIKVLEIVDVIFSEDTRVTLNLLNHFDIKKMLISLHEHNEDVVKDKVLEYLNGGSSVALVTDRGTPIISDPGYKTVKYISDNGFNVVSLPGATALIPALTVSGIKSQPFLFYGFLDSKESKRKKELEKLKDNEYTMIFYEAPHRIIKTLNLMMEVFGDRYISISREISKKFETIYRGRISKLIPQISDKGEFVIVVSGSEEKEIDNNLTIKEAVDLYINAGLDVMSAIKKVAREREVSKSEIYKSYHQEEK